MAINNPELTALTINWQRCIHVDDEINDDLLRKLTPKILELRQESSLPITVAINSPGGALDVVDSLIALLTGPNQDNDRCSIITVSVHRAYSAAANLLAAGRYAVALPNSDILFHDVRYSGIRDVTPKVAKVVANRLQEANDEFSLRLAHIVFRRLVWNYIDLRKHFKKAEEDFPKVYERYKRSFECCSNGHTTANVDMVGFATALYANVSPSCEDLIDNAIRRLYRWGVMTTLVGAYSSYKTPDSTVSGLLDGLKYLFDELRGVMEYKDGQVVWEKAEANFKIYASLLVEQFAVEENPNTVDFHRAIENANEDFKLIDSINDPQHHESATKQLIRHSHIFFDGEALEAIDGDDEVRRTEIMKQAMPTAKLFWHFCVLLCRELFNGEHKISPHDAQVLGLVDEVVGGGRIESRRDFRRKKVQSSEESA